MHLFVIAWLYVVLMMAVVSDSLLKAILRLLVLGLLPVLLWAWLARRRKLRAQHKEPEA